MARQPRVVAELGRPETPEEAAERKAVHSAAYRSSQNLRNLIAALIVTLGVVLVVVFAVPRGTPPPREDIDVAAVAERISENEGRQIIVPDVPGEWRVNVASVEGDTTRAWTIVYVPGEEQGFVRVAQGFDADPAWTTRVLRGADADETVTIDGVAWTRYDIADAEAAGNVTSALSAQAGPDVVLVYGNAPEADIERTAESVSGQVRELQEAAE
ncbi:DUF4245 family protein [Microbacterium immunditiarum]|uniref:DUF4245 domain-containing protein n=1 Tax=Microbacterium immunditiarum TaxID=337480 RepID=A0A7Y9KLK1_9MICO|nr:DUF4245 family protein [Microbacterium immunditiarum]NYE19839.1 hypothetical protein [Microbacterium immunditiarum]